MTSIDVLSRSRIYVDISEYVSFFYTYIRIMHDYIYIITYTSIDVDVSTSINVDSR